MANDNAPQCGKCSRMMENYDHTNSNSRDCTCDKCHFLLAGYSCLQIHDPQGMPRAAGKCTGRFRLPVPRQRPSLRAVRSFDVHLRLHQLHLQQMLLWLRMPSLQIRCPQGLPQGSSSQRSNQRSGQRNGQRSDRLHFQRVISRKRRQLQLTRKEHFGNIYGLFSQKKNIYGQLMFLRKSVFLLGVWQARDWPLNSISTDGV